MTSSPDVLIKNLSGIDLKYLSHYFIGNFLELVKKKDVHPYECMDSLKKFCDENLSERYACFSSVKKITYMLLMFEICLK